jgi:hypothetical protein
MSGLPLKAAVVKLPADFRDVQIVLQKSTECIGGAIFRFLRTTF